MNALEKAAKAVEDVMASDDNMPADIARAVLMAVREVDNATGWVGAGIIQGPVGGSAYTAATDCFAGMIDAILSQP